MGVIKRTLSYFQDITKFQVKLLNQTFELPVLIIGMRIAGIWPFNFSWLIYWLFFSSTFITVCGEFGAVFEYWPDVTRECIVGSTIITGVRSLFVCILLCKRRREFQQLIEKFVSRIYVTETENEAVYCKIQKGIKLSNYISMSMVSSLFLFLILPLVSSHENKDEMFPFLIDFPFDYQSPLGFCVVYFFCIMAGIGSVASVIGHDTLMNYMILHTCMRLQVLTSRIQMMDEHLKESLPRDDNYIDDELKNIVLVHCEIISFVNEMENLFSPHILMHFLVTSLLVCILGIQILFVQQNALEKTKILLYFITSLGQIYVSCESGEKLIQNSTHIAWAVYSFKWQDLSTKYRANILLMIQRAQKPLKLTAGKFFDLSMVTFNSILKTSGSYFALLKQLIEDH